MFWIIVRCFRALSNALGLRPFQFKKIWLEKHKFKKVAEEMWSRHSCSWWIRVVLNSKLRVLKGALRGWSKVEYENMDPNVDKLMEDVSKLDLKGEVICLGNREVATRKFLFRELWKLLKCKKSMMVQRARSSWLKKLDANTKYFHRCVKIRANRNSIKDLKVEID